MDTNKNNEDIKIEIKVDESIAGGIYSNFTNISHSPEEFILDFLFVHPTPPPGFGKMISRIIMSPSHAKRLVQALGQNIKEYEVRFGQIKVNGQPEEMKKSPVN